MVVHWGVTASNSSFGQQTLGDDSLYCILICRYKVNYNVWLLMLYNFSQWKASASCPGKTSVMGVMELLSRTTNTFASPLQKHAWNLLSFIRTCWTVVVYLLPTNSHDCLIRTNLELELVHRGGNLCSGGASAAAKRSCLSKYLLLLLFIFYTVSYNRISPLNLISSAICNVLRAI